jgi:rhodanese-related sulfurtransferase
VGLGIGYNLLHPKPLPWKAEPRKTVTLEDAAGVLDPPAERTERPQKMDPPPTEMTPVKQPDTRTQMTPVEPSDPPPTPDLYADIPESQFPIEIGLAKVKEFYDRRGLLILDAREPDEFAEGHLQGAMSAPADAMMGDVDWLDATAKDPRPIMIYCDGGDCELSLNLGFELTQSGHRKVLVFTDGFLAWKEAGYPTETGETP